MTTPTLVPTVVGRAHLVRSLGLARTSSSRRSPRRDTRSDRGDRLRIDR
jgi:hypothetical protein